MKNRRVLWVNPSFLDYRIPLYLELNKCCGGNFYLIYSKERIPDRCHQRIQKELGTNALFVSQEKIIEFGKKSEFANSGVSIPFPKGLYKIIKNIKPDILIAEGFFQFTPWAVIYALLHRKPLLIAYERTAHTERNCPLWRKSYRKFINLFVSGYVVNGSLTKEYLMSQGVKEKNIFTGAMCADSKMLAKKVGVLTPEDIRLVKTDIFNITTENGKYNSSTILYLFVGRMIPLKGICQLLSGWREHIKEHPYDRLLLVGDGPNLEEYKKKAEDMDSVIFTGGIDYSTIYKYYAISDVFVIPTLEDNWSLVVPEAMACGLPVACSIYNGCHPELVHKDVNGITFDPLNCSSTVNALNYFHHINLKEFGTASKAIEEKFSPKNVADNILKAINSYL